MEVRKEGADPGKSVPNRMPSTFYVPLFILEYENTHVE